MMPLQKRRRGTQFPFAGLKPEGEQTVDILLKP